MKANQNQKVNAQRKLSIHEKKHQVNLKDNSGLHFQIGLIVVLFMVFGILQLRFDKKEYIKPLAMTEESDGMITPPNFVIEQPKAEPVKEIQPKRQIKSTTFIEIDNDVKITKELPILDKPVVLDKAPTINSIQVDEIPDEIDPISMFLVTQIPTFPGCDKFKLKKEKMACMSKKIAKHIVKKFDSDLAADNGISGTQKIMVMFTINTSGNIVDIKARTPHPALQKEAIKAIQSLPKMKPGKKGNKKVPVIFSQPIIFEVQ